MQETLEIPVTYKNQELFFKAHAVKWGSIHRIVVDVNGTNISIERDEEGNYRALGEANEMLDKKVDVELIKAIVEVLEGL